MNLKKFKGWLRRITTAENLEKTNNLSDEAGQPCPAAAERSCPGPRTPEHHQDAPRESPLLSVKQTIDHPPGLKTRPRPMTRQGIPILKPNEDMARHFLAQADAQEEGPPEKAPGPDAADQEGRRGLFSPDRAAKGPKAIPRRNRAGIRQLDGQRDLSAYFLPAAPEEPDSSDRPPAQRAAVPKRKTGLGPQVAAKDRHGIPRLDDQTDLRQYFEAALEDDDETPADEDLGEVFRTSLDHDTRRLMKKKTGGFFAPRRLSLKEKLRRYPAPQAQLDLHGDTALIARQRAESYLRTAGAAGTLTVRIIVGKGLHSESGAVLPDVIEDLLLTLKRDGRVLTFRWDKDLKRKSGSVIVYLEPPF